MAKKNKGKRARKLANGIITSEVVGNILGQIASDLLVPYLENT
jgi:hypothetical protein